MGLLDILRVLWNAADSVASLVVQWDPAGCATEIECRASLQRFLERKLQPLHVRESLSEGVPSDLVVQNKVAVAVHGKLDTSADYYRLMGRLAAYRGWHGAVLVVVTGPVAPELRERVEEYVKSGQDLPAAQFCLLQK
ncbi:MAG: hypothetical protein GWN84_02625 [Gammaproteobacteria bacterium]|nr:hypothetical protein [Gammaproteobacteria bacterium]NIR82047.1 hypothetical protein [Gammaproteobacteria bacterium]NIR89275.1 hypothetical protein [Gammaproteobacteria bacterium]NIU03157.1 hypothetical protein [Gammaproteobacteria bacterium]NIV50673.1 hypothetical protein [Gammaproteobacteria bacterium]